MRIPLPTLEGTCRNCIRGSDSYYLAISRYPDGGISLDTYCVWCLPEGKAVLREGATSTTVYDVYEPGRPVTRVCNPQLGKE